jgi:copper resistance protein C
MDRCRNLILFTTLMLLCVALPLYGHAVLLSATPDATQVMTGPDVPLMLRFNARVDARRSALVLVAPGGRSHALHIDEGSPPDKLISEAKGLKAGAYVLLWQVLATDGHITRGELHFRVQ